MIFFVPSKKDPLFELLIINPEAAPFVCHNLPSQQVSHFLLLHNFYQLNFSNWTHTHWYDAQTGWITHSNVWHVCMLHQERSKCQVQMTGLWLQDGLLAASVMLSCWTENWRSSIEATRVSDIETDRDRVLSSQLRKSCFPVELEKNCVWQDFDVVVVAVVIVIFLSLSWPPSPSSSSHVWALCVFFFLSELLSPSSSSPEEITPTLVFETFATNPFYWLSSPVN